MALELFLQVMHNSGRPVLEELIREACGNVDDFKFLQNVANIYKENGMEQVSFIICVFFFKYRIFL